MRNERSDGAGTLRPSSKQGKQKIQPAADSPAQRCRKIARLRKRREKLEERIDALSFYDKYDEDGRPRSPLPGRRTDINKELERLTALGDGGERLEVKLDDFGSALVRQFLETHPRFTLEDVVNGALTFTLGADDDHDWPEEADKASVRRAAEDERIRAFCEPAFRALLERKEAL